MRVEFVDEDNVTHQIRGVKINEADELIAAIKVVDSHVIRFYRDVINKGGSNEPIGLWVGLNSTVKQAISLILKLSGIEKKWTEFSVSDINRLLLDNKITNEQAIIRKANGYSYSQDSDTELNDSNTTIHQRYLIMILYYLGGEFNRFDDALTICRELSPDDCNQVLAALSQIKDGKMPEVLALKQQLEVTDERLAKFLVDAGFGEFTDTKD